MRLSFTVILMSGEVKNEWCNPCIKRTMDTLPTTHVLTKGEEELLESFDDKHKELHQLAIQWLQTSYRLEWSYMYTNRDKHK